MHVLKKHLAVNKKLCIKYLLSSVDSLCKLEGKKLAYA